MPEHTDAQVTDLLTRAHKIFTDRIAKRGDNAPRPHNGYGRTVDDCCLTGALHLVLTDGRKTYDADNELKSPVFVGALERIARVINSNGDGQRITPQRRTVPSVALSGYVLTKEQRDAIALAREIEFWHDTQTTDVPMRDVLAQAIAL